MQGFTKWGLILTGLTTVWLVLMHSLGFYESAETSQNIYDLLFIFITPFIVLWFSIAEDRKSKKGKYTFKNGFIQGLKTSLVFGITSPFVYAAYYIILNPGFIDYARQAYGLGNANDFIVIGSDMLAQLVSAIVGGSIYAAIISKIILKKTK